MSDTNDSGDPGASSDSGDSPPSPSTRLEVVALAAAVEGGLVILALALGWLIGVPALATFRWDALDALQGVGSAVPMLLAFVFIDRWPVGPLARVKHFGETVVRPFLNDCTTIDLLGISVLAGLGEELLFRAVLQGWMGQHLPPWAALLIASILFGVLHAVTATYAVLAFLAGLYLGWLYQVTGNVLVPAVCHAAYDFVVLLVVMSRDVRPGVRLFDEAEGAADGDGARGDQEGE